MCVTGGMWERFEGGSPLADPSQAPYTPSTPTPQGRMRLRLLLSAAVAVPAFLAAPATAQERTDAWQIAAAVLPLPDSMRPGARVLGYRGVDLVVLREGTNEMICLADDPRVRAFQVSCYHASLEPFMEKGRALRAAGITRREAVDSARLDEVKRGRIVMPSAAILSSVFAENDSFDALAGPPAGATALDVLYLPYATAETTGVSEQPAPDRPWLMFPGKPWAHVMLPR